jgi:hypothetical protein
MISAHGSVMEVFTFKIPPNKQMFFLTFHPSVWEKTNF